MKKISLFILFILTFASCEEVLDIKPRNILSDAYFWTTENTVQGYVDYAYFMLTEYTESGYGQRRRVITWGHFRGEATDEAYAHVPLGGGQDLTSGKLNPSTRSAIGSWIDFYSVIQHINVFFYNYELGRFDVNADKLAVWMGEMHFLRAYSYNQLIKAYGGVIIATEPFKPEDPIDQVRSSYDDCVDFILDEIDAALVGLLPAP